MKKTVVFLLMLCLVLPLASCTTNTESPTASPTPANARIEKTVVQNQADNYQPIREIGAFNQDIITLELLSACTLGEVDKAALPYWNGYILENKISVNFESENWWNEYTPGPYYFLEDEIKYLNENGFNCARVLYSLSFLGNPSNPDEINVSQLEQLDELIAWGAKYNIHIMLSITGVPNKWNTSWEEEGVQSNDIIFTDGKIQALFTAYWDLLAKRYAKIPSGLLSFELLAEPAIPNGDLQQYCDVLSPVTQRIWSHNPNRIVIANDAWKQVPEQLASLGCCLSYHSHIYTLDKRTLEGFGIPYESVWPMQYLPMSYSPDSGKLVLECENSLKKGILHVYYGYVGTTMNVSADGQTLLSPEPYQSEEMIFKTSCILPQGTKKLTFTPSDWGSLMAISIEQEDAQVITIPTHNLYGPDHGFEPFPTIMIHDDGTLENMDHPPHLLNSAYILEKQLKPYIDCAKRNHVSFIMTEVGTDTLELSPTEYVEYHEMWLGALKENNIGWMYNCVHNALAPKNLMWLNDESSKFTQFSNTDIPNYQVNDVIMDMLKRYQ
ncbi:cellulase (glycosyl hydrolase family 5) [Anaerotignum neopropionicum]|uniref:Cellulase (Glycosyl hydrolase family 5) n=1 Tax=Anaerotignum neopropionicum TaxID=36847 RepID=A0A136WEG7_9FIRM|nr:cellulase family glycosylhydrolase [Anaerotignum neopropionicum]KXL52905.1 cellulase (glycosyl hydrolase family 5) [Anaerotignum neopropionicum]